MSLIKNWRLIGACLLALGALGGVFYIRHLVAEKEKLQVALAIQAADLEVAKANAQAVQKARQVKERNVTKANIPDADVIDALATNNWLRVD